MSLMSKIEDLVIRSGTSDGPKADVCEPGESPSTEDLENWSHFVHVLGNNHFVSDLGLRITNLFYIL